MNRSAVKDKTPYRYVYHGTHGEIGERILQEGIRPRNQTKSNGNWQHTVDSNLDMVYLTRLYPGYFALTSMPDEEHVKDARLAIVEVDLWKLDSRRLFPDEDFVEQAGRDGFLKETMPDKDMKERTEWVRKHIHGFKDFWPDSLQHMGSVCYRNRVPQRAIRRVAFFRPESNSTMLLHMMDPTITLANVRFVGSKYEVLTHWLMGDSIDPDLLWVENKMEEGSRLSGWQERRKRWAEVVAQQEIEVVWTKKGKSIGGNNGAK